MRVLQVLTLAVLVVIGAACKSKNVVGPTPSIQVTLSKTSLTIQQGGTDDLVATVSGAGGFSGTASVTVEGVPAGVTAGISNVSSNSGTTTATVTVTVAASTAPGNSTITVRASANGVSAVTATLSLTVTAAPAVALSLAPNALTINQGESGTSTVTITRTNFTGNVTLALEGQSGVSGSFNPAPATGTTSALTMQVGAGVAPGTYSMTVRATGTGISAATTTLSLTVAPPPGGFTIAVNPTAVGVSRDGGSAVLVSINRTGSFTGPVDLSVTGAPNGLAATFTASSVTSNGTSLKLTATQALAEGSYPLVVKGTATGFPERTVTVNAKVNTPTVSLDFTGCGTGTPIWLAIQDGTAGAWVETLAPNGAFKARPTETKVGLAIVTTGFGGNRSVLIQYTTAAELQGATGDVVCGNPTLPARTASASTTGLGVSQLAFVSFGGAARSFTSTLPSGTLSGIAPGPHDLVAVKKEQQQIFTSADRLIIRRDLNPANGGPLGSALNFSAAEAFAPISALISVTGFAAGETLNAGTTAYLTEAACYSAPLWGSVLPAGNTSFIAYGVPPAQQRPTDWHAISVNTFVITPTFQQFRQVTEYSNALTARTIALPTPLAVPTITRLTAPYNRLEFQFTLTPEATATAFVNYGLSAANAAFITATSGWLGGTSATIAFPDFTGSADWDNAWGPANSANPTSWTIGASGSTGTACGTGRTVGLNRSGTF